MYWKHTLFTGAIPISTASSHIPYEAIHFSSNVSPYYLSYRYNIFNNVFNNWKALKKSAHESLFFIKDYVISIDKQYGIIRFLEVKISSYFKNVIAQTLYFSMWSSQKSRFKAVLQSGSLLWETLVKVGRWMGWAGIVNCWLDLLGIK